MDKGFIDGKALCRGFFFDHGKPCLDKRFPGLKYSAGLLGYGSDVIGYDDEVSTDHMWGPRFYLFLSPGDKMFKARIIGAFSQDFPYLYKGYSVNFSVPDPNDNGVRHAEPISSGKVSPLVFIHTIDEFLADYLGISDTSNISPRDWLSFSEHRLLGLSSGDIYHDGLGLSEKLAPLRFYPRDIKLYLIASQWGLIAEEQAFVKRCGARGDELGSRIICARIAERLMRLCFLYLDTYAPYSKWFGTAFGKLGISADIEEAVNGAVAAGSVAGREDMLVTAQRLVAGLHNRCGLTEPVQDEVQPYFGRDIKVIHADRIARATWDKLESKFLKSLPLAGTLSQVANFTTLSDNPAERNRVLGLYE